MAVEVTVVLSLIMAIAAITTLAVKLTSASKKEGERYGAQTATLGHIKERIDEVWADQKTIKEQLEKHERRICALEERFR